MIAALPRRPLLALAFALLAACDGDVAAAPDAWVTIRGQRVAAEIARTPAEQRLGLGERDELPWNAGMLFQYRRAGFYAFWMKGMRFDIDIVWIRDDRIIDISHRVPHVPGGNGPTVAPRELADRVLEVNAGYAASHGWRVGQKVRLERNPKAG